MTDIAHAETFITTHARLLERQRLELLLGRAGAAERVLAALAAYRNPDGGFGWGLEPDQRAPSSQPAGAYEGFQLLAEAAPATTSPLATALCDWAQRVTLPGGGLPFALAGAASPGTAPWWAGADPAEPSLHITAGICAHAHHLRAHDPAVAAHPWLAQATDWCLRQVAAQERPDSAYELAFTLGLLDAVVDLRPEASEPLERLAALIPSSGALGVHGPDSEEKLRPLTLSPLPGRPLRALMPAGAIERDLDALAAEQQPDGGWTVDFPSSSPAGASAWRGIATVQALSLLHANGRIALA